MKPAERMPQDVRDTPPPAAPRSRRWIVAGAVAVVLAVAAAIGVRAARKPEEPKYETAAVDRGRIVAQVTATGTLSALVTVQVGSQVSGRIASLHADFNSTVKKGQLIAKIDPQLFQAALDQARANLLVAKGDLASAKVKAADAARQADRTRALADRRLVAQQDLDTAVATADAARASVDASSGRVEQAQAALDSARVNLAYTNIVSPIDGTVISRNVDVGQTVAASLQAPTLFVLAEDLKKMQVDTSVAEADIGKLKDGMDATFTVDAYPGKRFRGRVREIRNSPQTVQNVVTYDAVVDVANPDLELRPGMTANVTFVWAERQEVVRVPNAGLRFRPPADLVAARKAAGGGAGGAGAQGGAGAGSGPQRGPGQGGGARRPDPEPDRRTVWVMKADGPAPVRIRVGVSDGSTTEVLEGDLHEGDRVVTDAPSSGGGGGGGGGGPGPRPPRIL
jgi:HlyD family secretion protein